MILIECTHQPSTLVLPANHRPCAGSALSCCSWCAGTGTVEHESSHRSHARVRLAPHNTDADIQGTGMFYAWVWVKVGGTGGCGPHLHIETHE